MQIKAEWNTTKYLLEWPKFRTPIILNVGKINIKCSVEWQEFSFIAGVNTKWYKLWKTVWQVVLFHFIFLQNEIYSYHALQQFHSLIFTQELKIYVHTKPVVNSRYSNCWILNQPRCPWVDQQTGTFRQWTVVQ